MVETHVPYPTDINLLYDAVRKVIQLTSQLSQQHHLTDWRQHVYNVKQMKRQLRLVQKKKRTVGRGEQQKRACEQAMKRSHQELISLSQFFLTQSDNTLEKIRQLTTSIRAGDVALIEEIQRFKHHADRQIDQIDRRVLQGDRIPHEEKVFSLFQPHTEWIVKGKAGVPVELGVRVCILEDQHQFILHHRVMEKETDDLVAVPMVEHTKMRFPVLSSCSFDKGFHSPENQTRLSDVLDVVAVKRKGKLSQKMRLIESSEAFRKARQKHAAVESAIHGLEVHGLHQCRDHGIDGFKRYVALAIVARNIHQIGHLLHKKAQAKLKRQRYRDQKLLLAA